MIWATVSSRSCFCWLNRASPSSAAKNIFNLISVLNIWWCPCVELLLYCWKKVFAMISVFSWQNSVSFTLLHCVLQGQTCLLLQLSLDFLLCIPVPYSEKDCSLIQVYAATTNAQEAEVERFYEKPTGPRTSTKKRCPFHHRGLECKSRKSKVNVRSLSKRHIPEWGSLIWIFIPEESPTYDNIWLCGTKK